MALTDLLRRLWPQRRRTSASVGTAQFVGAWAQTETPQATDSTYPTGYTSNGWVYACVDAIGEAVSSAPLRVQVQRGEEWVDAPEHPLQVLLDSVNADQSQTDLLFATSAWCNLHGNAYWRLLFDEKKDPNKRKPLAIQVLRPDRTTVKAGRGIRSGKVAGYDYDTGTLATAQQYTEHYTDIEVVHFKRFAPTDDYYGQSPLFAITQIVNAYNAAMRFNAAFFSGGGVPSSIITTVGHADDDLLAQVRAMWDQWVARSSDKRRPLILECGMTLTTPGVAPDQVGTETLPRMLREEICAAMGVPPALVGLYEYASYANANAQRRIFYAGTVNGEWKRICSTITEFFTLVYPEKVFRVIADTSAIAAMQPDWLEAANAAAVLVRSRIIIPDEAREKLLGMPPLENGLGRVIWGNATEVPIATADDGLLDLLTAAPAPPPVAPTEPASFPAGSTEAQQQAEKAIVPRIIRITEDAPHNKRNLTEAQKVAHWNATDRRRIGEERFLTRVMDRWYADITAEVLANISASAKALAPERVKDPVEDLLFDIDNATTHLQNVMGDALSDVTGREWQHALGTVGSDIDFDISDPRAQAMLKDRTLQMVTVADTAQSTVRNAIAEGLAEGETVDDLRRRVQTWSKGIAKRHAENVARTEAGICMNTSARNGYQDGGADGTEWLSARDERSRDWHADMDGKTRKWDEKFTLNPPGKAAIECDGPGDPKLGPGDVCQCRCANAPWFADEASASAKPPKKPTADSEPVPVGTVE